MKDKMTRKGRRARLHHAYFRAMSRLMVCRNCHRYGQLMLLATRIANKLASTDKLNLFDVAEGMGSRRSA